MFLETNQFTPLKSMPHETSEASLKKKGKVG